MKRILFVVAAIVACLMLSERADAARRKRCRRGGCRIDAPINLAETTFQR